MTLLFSTSAHNNKSFTPGVPSHHATTSYREIQTGEEKKGGEEKSDERKKRK
jgi:hypothetical protein